jgi:hypothetical protein
MWVYEPTAQSWRSDGTPFPGLDSFERAYNDRLSKGLDIDTGPRGVPGPAEGFPLSTRTFLRKPANLRAVMDRFFAPDYEALCKGLGNTDVEWRTLASRLLCFAAMEAVPMTAPERAIATRLGIDPTGNPSQP